MTACISHRHNAECQKLALDEADHYLRVGLCQCWQTEGKEGRTVTGRTNDESSTGAIGTTPDAVHDRTRSLPNGSWRAMIGSPDANMTTHLDTKSRRVPQSSRDLRLLSDNLNGRGCHLAWFGIADYL
jgi:hypothetical protein